jgi:hypothetical protein
MAGKINAMIKTIIDKRANGSEMIARTVHTRLVIKGINPEKYSANSEDDPVIIAKLQQIAQEFGIKL